MLHIGHFCSGLNLEHTIVVCIHPLCNASTCLLPALLFVLACMAVVVELAWPVWSCAFARREKNLDSSADGGFL